MATWVRNGTGTSPQGVEADVTGSISLTNGTAPGDFDPTNVTSVEIAWRLTIANCVADTWVDHQSAALIVNSVEVATLDGGDANRTADGNYDHDLTDSSPATTGTVAQWEAATLDPYSGDTVWVTYSKYHGGDSGNTATIPADSNVVVTITYTPSTLQVTPALHQQLTQPFAPTVTTGSVSITPSLVQQLTVAFGPTVSTVYQVSPALVVQLAAGISPVLTTGPVTVTPTLVQQLATAFGPTVATSGGTQTITPGLVQQLVQTFGPTVTVGAATITPNLVQQFITTADPTVTTGPVTIIPTLTQQVVTAFNPALTATVTIIPNLIQQLAVALAPVSVTTGSQHIIPSLAQQLTVAFDPGLHREGGIQPSVLTGIVATPTPPASSRFGTKTVKTPRRPRTVRGPH